MKAKPTNVFERVNITLPKRTLELIDLATKKGNRSGFINTAIQFYLEKETKRRLRKRLKEGYVARAAENLQIAEEWRAIEDEVWNRLYQDEK